MFSMHEQSEMKKQLDPAKPVHEPWVELNNNNDTSVWELNQYDHYSGLKEGQNVDHKMQCKMLHTLQRAPLFHFFY